MIKAEVLRDQDQVIELLTDKQQVIGMFQNGSEWGPRALGNRSILFDPTNPTGIIWKPLPGKMTARWIW